MDRIIQSYMDDFLKSMQLKEKDSSKRFELFSSYCAISQIFDDSFDLNDTITGSGADCGIDAIGIIVNGIMVSSVEEVEDILKGKQILYDVTFVFVQAKQSEKFSSKDMQIFGEGVLDFISENPQLARNEEIIEKCDIFNRILKYASKMKKTPVCLLYYVTTGKWTEDKNCKAVIDRTKRRIEEENIFSDVEFTPVDADMLRKYYRDTVEDTEADITFSKHLLLPDIDKVKQAYLGYLNLNEYLKLIQDEEGNLRRSIFTDNVRDYQGDVPVNQEIADTIRTDADKFIVFNNGVTIICGELNNSTRDNFILKSYQIVNGCQTSHEIFKNKDKVKGNLQIPVKIIETTDEETINKIIKATNRQTKVGEEQFIALNSFHFKLEEYYKSFPIEQRLYYERRSKQYNYIPGIEKARVISIATQIKALASMFFDKPNLASRYYGQLLKQVDGMFGENDRMEPYYTCAFMLYRLEYYFRNGILSWDYRKYRYHILMMIKYDIANGKKIPNISENKITDFCDRCNKLVMDDTKFKVEVNKMISIIGSNVNDVKNRELTKSAELVEKLKIYVAGK